MLLPFHLDALIEFGTFVYDIAPRDKVCFKLPKYYVIIISVFGICSGHCEYHQFVNVFSFVPRGVDQCTYLYLGIVFI